MRTVEPVRLVVAAARKTGSQGRNLVAAGEAASLAQVAGVVVEAGVVAGKTLTLAGIVGVVVDVGGQGHSVTLEALKVAPPGVASPLDPSYRAEGGSQHQGNHCCTFCKYWVCGWQG